MLMADVGRLVDPSTASDRSRYDLLIDGMNRLDYAVAHATYDDMAEAPELLDRMMKRASFPFISTNVVSISNGEPILAPYQIEQADPEHRVAFLALSSARKGEVRLPGRPAAKVADAVAAAKKYVGELREKVSLIIVLARFTYEDAKTLAESVPGIDVIIGGDGAYLSPGFQPQFVNDTFILYHGDQGKYVGRIAAFPSGKVVDKLVTRVIALDRNMADEPEMAALVAKHRTAAPKAPAGAASSGSRPAGGGLIRFDAGAAQTQKRM